MKYPEDLQGRYCILLWLVFALHLDPARKKLPSGPGISVRNLELSSAYKKAAIKPNQTSFAALFFVIQGSSSFFSNYVMRRFLVDKYRAIPESWYARFISATSLFPIGFFKFRLDSLRTNFFSRKFLQNSSESTHNTTLELIPFHHRVNF